MYTKDKNTRITLRLNDAQFAFVKENADVLGVSPSEFLRMVINATLSRTKEVMAEYQRKGGLGRENDETGINNIV